MADYPEHARMSKVSDRSQTIGEFLDWLRSTEIVLAEWGTEDWDETLFPINTSIEKLLARFFQIDLQKIAEEKDQMIAELRAMNERNNNAN